MQMNRCTFGILVSILLLTALTSVSSTAKAAGSRPSDSPIAETTLQMSQEELQAAVISYANRFIATIGQAAFDLETAIQTKEGRLVAAARKVYSLSAVAEIAAGPRPGPALLDLVVLTTLNRMVWDAYWRPQVFGMPASIMVDAFENMEADAWRLAGMVMTAAQMEELRDLIVDWLADHPDQVAVDYIRFSDFGGLGKKPNLKEIQKPGGLLAPVREAVAAVDEVRMTSERAMFLLTKMQLIMGFQAELIYKQLATQPEMDTLLADISGFRKTADRFADMVEKLPAQVAGERSAALADAGQLIARERTAVLKAVDDRTGTIRQINADIQQTLDRVTDIFKQLETTTTATQRLMLTSQETVVVMRDLVTTADRLASRFEAKEGDAPSKPFDINEYISAIEKVHATLESLNSVALSIDRISTPLVTQLLNQFNQAADERVDHIFLRLFQLVVAIGIVIIVVLLVHRFSRQRRPAN